MVRMLLALACAITFSGVAIAAAPGLGSGGHKATGPPMYMVDATSTISPFTSPLPTATAGDTTVALCHSCAIALGQTPTKGLTEKVTVVQSAIPACNDDNYAALGGAVHNLA